VTDIQADVAKVRAWEANAKPGELPSIEVHAAALRIQNHLAAQGAGQRVESAIDRFMRTVRQDSPAQMSAYDRALVGNSQPPPGERAADRFKRLRLANVKS
jgi:hypothetical protein